jgi:subtilisin family serine protease
LRSNGSVLIVCGAGNDHDRVPVRFASPMTYAAFVLGVNNIIVVGAQGPTGAHSTLSNSGGHVEAPGELILSATTNNGYATFCGTSMATAFVSGLAGYLLAMDPALTPPELKSLIQAHGQNVDAFTSAMESTTCRAGIGKCSRCSWILMMEAWTGMSASGCRRPR